MSISKFISCPFVMLAAATELALQREFKASSKLIEKARNSASIDQIHSVSLLAMCVSSELSRAMQGSTIQTKSKHTEFSTVHYWFRSNYHVIKDAILDSCVTCYTGSYRPDFYVIVDNEKRPVECKKSFTDRSKNQLDSYLKNTGASIGYAVAFELKCKLPDNMIFIKCPNF